MKSRKVISCQFRFGQTSKMRLRTNVFENDAPLHVQYLSTALTFYPCGDMPRVLGKLFCTREEGDSALEEEGKQTLYFMGSPFLGHPAAQACGASRAGVQCEAPLDREGQRSGPLPALPGRYQRLSGNAPSRHSGCRQ